MSSGKLEIERDKLFTSEQLVKALEIRRDSLTVMYRCGLPYFASGTGPKSKRFVNGGDLLDFMKVFGLAQRMVREGFVTSETEGENDADDE